MELKLAGAFDCSLLTSKSANGIHVFPIPFKDELNIEINTGYDGNYDVTVYDVQGRNVLNKQFAKNNRNHKFTIETSLLPKGSYFIQVKSNQEVYTQKLIK